MKHDIAYIFFIAVLVIGCIVPAFVPEWIFAHCSFYSDCGLINRFVYPFFHRTPLHLALNFIVLLQLNSFLDRFFEGDNLKERRIIAVVSYIICVGCSFCSNSYLPTIGLSGYTSAKYGIIVSVIDPKDILIAAITLAAFNLGFMLIGGVNFILHISCFIVGLFFGLIRERKYT